LQQLADPLSDYGLELGKNKILNDLRRTKWYVAECTSEVLPQDDFDKN